MGAQLNHADIIEFEGFGILVLHEFLEIEFSRNFLDFAVDVLGVVLDPIASL